MIPVGGYYEIPKRLHSYDWDSLVEKIEKYGIRNSWTTTIAPTGTFFYDYELNTNNPYLSAADQALESASG